MATPSKLKPGAMVRRKGDRSVPEGFVLVPRKPTPEMLGAAAEHVIRVLDDCDDEPQYIALGVAAAAYKDMLAATPTPPAVASGEPYGGAGFIDSRVARGGVQLSPTGVLILRAWSRSRFSNRQGRRLSLRSAAAKGEG